MQIIVINPSVCLSVHLSVCPRAYLWNGWTDPHEILYVDHLWPWLGPPLAALRYFMYFWFMEEVTFSCNGRDAETWRLHHAATAMNGVAILGRRLMSMNAC